MKRIAAKVFPGLLCAAALVVTRAADQPPVLQWGQLPSTPDRAGLAGPFAGVSRGALIVAGGANFPNRMPWEGGEKVWTDSIFVLIDPRTTWRKIGTLPRVTAYGVSLTTREGLVCAGGGDASRHFREVYLLRWRDGQVVREDLAPLPEPMAFGCGAVLGQSIYLAGGTEAPDAATVTRHFWTLNLGEAGPRWRSLEAWPGPGRLLPVAGISDGSFYLFSGAELVPGPEGKTVRRYLRDAYAYKPGTGWKRLADLPRPAVGAPSPAPLVQGKLLIISGDDGTQVNFEPKAQHPGFPRDVFAYDPRGDAWSRWGLSPLSRATVPAVEWAGKIVIPNGETRPGIRTPEVWTIESD